MYVTPKTNCPHLFNDKLIKIEEFKKLNFSEKCGKCEEIKENWICLYCGKFLCSRYINSHFEGHFKTEYDHCIGVSLLDLSFWCYKCDSYILSQVNNNLF